MPASPDRSSPAFPPPLHFDRSIPAPRDLVVAAWTDPAQLATWWGPHGFTTTVHEWQPRVGGALRLDLTGPDGTVHPLTGRFESVAPDRLVFLASPLDANGRTLFTTRQTITFTAAGDTTRLRVEVAVTAATADAVPFLAGAAEGWRQNLERLVDHALFAAGSDREIVLSRVVDAPRELVWQAWTDPRHLAHWYGPEGFTLTTHEMKVAPNGVWRFTFHGPDGHQYENHITYLELEAPSRLRYKHGGGKDFEPVNFETTATFTDEGEGRTRITMRSTFASPNARKFVAEHYGAIEGGRQTLGRLGRYVRTLRGGAPVQPASRPFTISRVLRAPRDLVFTAWTETEHLAQWFGPAGCKLEVRRCEIRQGGMLHYGMHLPDGTVMWGRWRVLEVVRPQRLEFVVSFADPAGNLARDERHVGWPLEMHARVTFADHAGIGRGTLVTIECRALGDDPVELRTFDEGHASMQAGWTGTLDQLEAVLARLVAGA